MFGVVPRSKLDARVSRLKAELTAQLTHAPAKDRCE